MTDFSRRSFLKGLGATIVGGVVLSGGVAAASRSSITVTGLDPFGNEFSEVIPYDPFRAMFGTRITQQMLLDKRGLLGVFGTMDEALSAALREGERELLGKLRRHIEEERRGREIYWRAESEAQRDREWETDDWLITARARGVFVAPDSKVDVVAHQRLPALRSEQGPVLDVLRGRPPHAGDIE